MLMPLIVHRYVLQMQSISSILSCQAARSTVLVMMMTSNSTDASGSMAALKLLKLNGKTEWERKHERSIQLFCIFGTWLTLK